MPVEVGERVLNRRLEHRWLLDNFLSELTELEQVFVCRYCFKVGHLAHEELASGEAIQTLEVLNL